MVREAAGYGTRAPGARLDWSAVVARQHEIVGRLRPAPAAFEKAGARVVLGEARFRDARTVEVGGAALTAERVVIAAGSVPVVPDLPGREHCITSDHLLFLPTFPDPLTLVGAGAIGLEMASAFADLGARVVVIGRDPEILPGLDADVAGYLRHLLERRGITFRLGATVERVDGRRGALVARGRAGAEPFAIPSAEVCLAVGRRFRPEMIGGQRLGLTGRGPGLEVTPYLRTPVPHIYAAGDATGHRQLTTVAASEGRLAALNALRGDHEVADHTVVPQTVFTTPEIASVGMTHAQSQARGLPCAVSHHDTAGASNGVATGEDGGFVKLVFDRRDGRLAGAQVVSYAAAELIQLCALAMRSGATADHVAAQLSIHPSHGERLIKAFGPELREVCEP